MRGTTMGSGHTETEEEEEEEKTPHGKGRTGIGRLFPNVKVRMTL
jgi:hypothetical protein